MKRVSMLLLAVVAAFYPCLAHAQPAAPAVDNFGVQLERLGPPGVERIELNGRPIAQGDALMAVQDGLPADKDLLRVTVFGSDAARQRVAADMAQAPADLRERFVFQAYPREHWVADAGFDVSGDPTIYVQTPQGAVLHRQTDYGDGAEGVFGAIRKADPKYTPSKDPDLRKGFSLGSIDLKDLLLLGLAGAAVWGWTRRNAAGGSQPAAASQPYLLAQPAPPKPLTQQQINALILKKLEALEKAVPPMAPASATPATPAAA